MEIISATVIAFTGAWFVNYYYSKKKEHDLDFLQRVVNVIEAAKVEWIDKPKKKE